MEAFGIDNIELHVEVTSMTEAAPPRVVDGRVLFSYEPSGRTITGPRFTRYVGVAFEHENYSEVHVFSRNQNGIFFLIYPIPSDGRIRTLRYRYIVDGLWLPDPENPNRVRDVAGIAISYVDVPVPEADQGDLPRLQRSGRMLFAFRGEPGRIVHIAGSFTNWDPFMHRLRESAPGEYSITLRLPPGTYAYYFVVDGERVLDPFNPDTAYDLDGNPASRVTVPSLVALDPAAQ